MLNPTRPPLPSTPLSPPMFHILYESTPWNNRAALFNEEGQLVSLRFDDIQRTCTEGAVIWGRVAGIEPSLGAAYVEVGDPQPGFLPLNTLPEGTKLTKGQGLVVRVTRGGFGEKGARLTGQVATKAPPAGTAMPSLLIPHPPALTRVLHDAGTHPVTCWVNDTRAHDGAVKVLPERSIHYLADNPEAEWMDKLDTELERILSDKPTWPIPGGNLIVEITSAVATIDVNATPQGAKKAGDCFKVNMAAAAEVARLCRLLDLGGSVIVDFITPRTKSQRVQIAETLSHTLHQTDDHFVEARPMSRFGLLELNRQRTRPSLTLLLKNPLFVAGAITLTLSRLAADPASPRCAITVQCHPQVASLLATRLTPAASLSYLGRPLTVTAVPGFSPAHFALHSS